MHSWLAEIEELHNMFESYFLGTTTSLARAEVALAAEFAIVGPDGVEADRAQTMAALLAGHGHTSSLEISITDAELILETNDIVVARYVENHQLSDRTNHRLATVVFIRSPAGPNGLLWRRVHETWIA